jgi:hypothetical protein
MGLLAPFANGISRGNRASLQRRPFHFQRARKEQVVFQMNVVVQVPLELPQQRVERPPGCTGMGWDTVVARKLTDFGEL